MNKTKENPQTKERRIVREDAAYPDKLKKIFSPPKALYVRGSLPDPERPAVAVIGARRCSRYGREMAEYYAGELAGAGVQIISGMAEGIDGVAQWAALEAGGKSFGVLGCGTDVCYPASNRRLYERLLAQGGVISEYPAQSPPLAWHFPVRNRIISGLADLALVIEARAKSGTLITVDFALEQGKDVFALPGRLDDPLSGGCNRLLFQGAGISLSPEDILENLYRRGRLMEGARDRGKKEAQAGREGREPEPPLLSEKQRLVWECLDERPASFEELFDRILAREPGYTAPGLMETLTEMMLSGTLLSERDGGFSRKRADGFQK